MLPLVSPLAREAVFFDLVFVSAVARIGDDLRGEDRAEYLAISDYMILFLSIYSLWERNVMYSTRFYQDDVFNKIWFSAVMIGVVVLAVHATGGMHGESIQLFCLTRAALSFIVHLPWANVALQIHKYSGHAVSMCIVGVLETVLYAAAGYVPVEYRKYLMLMSVCVLQLQFTRVLLARATKGWVPFPSAPSPVDIEHLSGTSRACSALRGPETEVLRRAVRPLSHAPTRVTGLTNKGC